MATMAVLPHVGTVGMKLLYPDRDTIQHAGITGIHQGPMHKLQRLSDSEIHYFGANRGIHDMAGVTAACLMVRKDVFLEAGAFFEGLAVAFNDVDLNYRILEKGYYNVCCNQMSMLHHESLSRGDDNADAAKTERLMRENDLLQERHPHMYERDPFYHCHLENEHVIPEYEFAQPEEISPDQMPPAVIRKIAGGYPEKYTDRCVRVRIDYAGAMKRWNRLYYTGSRRNAPHNDEGVFIQGYSFVIGSDNAIFDRMMILRQVKSEDDRTPVTDTVYTADVADQVRLDIARNLRDQVNVELTGFRARILPGVLPEGCYQIGFIYKDATSRLRVLNWGGRCIVV
jgi:hypothetical protein